MSTLEKEEATERQLAELEFVKCAYGAEEAWPTDTDGCRSVVRLLHLPVELSNNKLDPVTIELHLQMPSNYPVNKEALLEITSTLKSAPSNPPLIRKAVLNALPQLTEACQAAACEFPEQEAVWHVFNRADEWIESNWSEILIQQEQLQVTKSTDSTKHVPSNILGRRCIYSHHIIANSKRKVLAKLAHDYKLGGYVKIGWPGIIIFEGLESSCQAVVHEIKTWRWQHLSIRVEETKQIPEGEIADEYRRLPKKFTELGEDDMSVLAQYCRDAGLENMFLQCLKIDNGQQSDNEAAEDESGAAHMPYAALIHVDHMNDRKGYQKWLKKESESAGCILFINHCTISKSSRPLIHVGLIGDEDGVKKILKQWRTSRVDVDSKNKPCLERMMSVLIEGEIPPLSRDALGRIDLLSSQLSSGGRITSFEELNGHVSCIFGEEWTRSLTSER
jgi:hypothetical protein